MKNEDLFKEEDNFICFFVTPLIIIIVVIALYCCYVESQKEIKKEYNKEYIEININNKSYICNPN